MTTWRLQSLWGVSQVSSRLGFSCRSQRQLHTRGCVKWSFNMMLQQPSAQNRWCLVQTLLAQWMGQFQWRLTGLKEREKARAMAKASQKTRFMEKESQKESKRARMTQRENPRMVIRKEKGNAGDRSKGKGKGEGNKCYICGRTRHFARECWQSQVRNVSSDVQQTATTAHGSPGSSLSGMSSVSQHVQQQGSQQPSSQTTQSRIARICEVSDDAKHGEQIFDLQDSSPSSFHGSVHAVRFFIGDADDCLCNGFVRAVVDEMDDVGEELHSSLIDSGADASIVPLSLLDRGYAISGVVGKLMDAQGSEIPEESVRDMEVRLKDITGKTICLKERVALSSRVSQPIISFGHLLEGGWSIDGREQALTHNFGAHIPVELQNRSLVVQGTIRVLHEEVHDKHVMYMSEPFKQMSRSTWLKVMLVGA